MIVSWATYKAITGDTVTPQATAEANLVRAQQRVEDRAERKFDREERTESLQVIDGKVWPKAYPIASVSLPDGATVSPDARSIAVSSPNYLDTCARLGILTAADRAVVLTTYVGGYATDEVPSDLVDIICEIAERYAMPAKTVGVPAGATAVGVNGQSYSGPVLGGSSALTPSLKNQIDRYKHIASRLAD